MQTSIIVFPGKKINVKLFRTNSNTPHTPDVKLLMTINCFIQAPNFVGQMHLFLRHFNSPI